MATMAFSMVTIRSMTIDCTVGCAVEGIRDSNEAQSLRRGVRDLYSYSNDIIINLVRRHRFIRTATTLQLCKPSTN